MTGMKEIELRLRQIWMPGGEGGKARQDWLRAEAARHARLAASARCELALELLAPGGPIPEAEVEQIAATLTPWLRERVRRRCLEIIALDIAVMARVQAAARLARRLRNAHRSSLNAR